MNFKKIILKVGEKGTYFKAFVAFKMKNKIKKHNICFMQSLKKALIIN
jgi:hypothetical protein